MGRKKEREREKETEAIWIACVNKARRALDSESIVRRLYSFAVALVRCVVIIKEIQVD